MTYPPEVTMNRRETIAAGIVAAYSFIVSNGGAKAGDAGQERIETLIAKMTIEEKVGQLTLFNDPFRKPSVGVNPEDDKESTVRVAELIRRGRVGALFNGIGAAAARRIQEMAVQESRLGIPLLFAADIIHGLRTIFPVPLAEAASWDLDLAERTARAAAAEGASSGIHQTYAPMVDIGRDQRWGRVVEGAGEDVLLGCLFAAARVRGFQGTDLASSFSLLATPKHFAAYGAAESGLDYNGVDISEHTLREVYLAPFRAALDAGALSIMSAFNDLNGVPSTGNHWLLTKILRGEWNFQGFVVSDFTADQELVAHGFAVNDSDAARVALTAGVDMSMQSGLYLSYLPTLLEQGKVSVADVDTAVCRVLRVKAALGLFDDPYRGTDPEVEKRVVGSGAHRALAREAARKAIVLLKNEMNLLPLPRSGRRIALIGPFGSDRQNVFGPWSIFADLASGVSVEDGFRAALSDPKLLSVVQGCGVESELEGGIDSAVAAAKSADLVVLAIGEAADMSAEAQSRVEIVIPAPQRLLAEAVAAVGKPVMVLLKSGRALELPEVVREADAIMLTWFLGAEEGHAIADLVFGDHSPTGRLPISFPHRSGQQPYYYSHKTTGRPEGPGQATFRARYRETSNSAMYPFGYGIGYAAVAYGSVVLSSDTLYWNGKIAATVRITNDGPRAIKELAQLYIRDKAATLTRPGRQLKAFRRVEIPPRMTVEVTFTIERTDLLFVGRDMKPTVEPGEFDLWIAPHAEAGSPVTFKLSTR